MIPLPPPNLNYLHGVHSILALKILAAVHVAAFLMLACAVVADAIRDIRRSRKNRNQ